MRIRHYNISVPASSAVEYIFDLSRAGKYLLWVHLKDLDLVQIHKKGRLLASGSSLDMVGATNGLPIFVFEPTLEYLSFTFYNYTESTVSGSVIFVLSSSLYADLIKAGFKLRTLLWTGLGEPVADPRTFLENLDEGRDYLPRLFRSYPGGITSLYHTGLAKVLVETSANHPLWPPFMLDTRLCKGDKLVGTHFLGIDVFWPWFGDVTFWDVPEGADEPDVGLPAIPAFPKPIDIEDGRAPFPEWPWKEDPFPVTPAVPKEPPWTGGMIPYPPTLSDRLEPTPPIPAISGTSIPRDIYDLFADTAEMPWADIKGLTSLVGIGPFMAHVLRMDSMGRVRQTDQATLYRAGKVEKSDSTTTTITPPRPGHRVSFKAVTLDWEIKVLTVYDLLNGKSMSDADTIYLDAGDSFSEPLEAVEIQVSCPTASGSSTGKLYYYVGI